MKPLRTTTRAWRRAGCPCGSGLKAKRCCLPVVEGAAAVDPVALLRARFCAYGWGAVDYLRTTSTATVDRAELVAYCSGLELVDLAIGEATTEGNAGAVSYTARLLLSGQLVALREDARYARIDGRWMYTGGALR